MTIFKLEEKRELAEELGLKTLRDLYTNITNVSFKRTTQEEVNRTLMKFAKGTKRYKKIRTFFWGFLAFGVGIFFMFHQFIYWKYSAFNGFGEGDFALSFMYFIFTTALTAGAACSIVTGKHKKYPHSKG